MVLLFHALCGPGYLTLQLRLTFYESNVAQKKCQEGKGVCE